MPQRRYRFPCGGIVLKAGVKKSVKKFLKKLKKLLAKSGVIRYTKRAVT